MAKRPEKEGAPPTKQMTLEGATKEQAAAGLKEIALRVNALGRALTNLVKLGDEKTEKTAATVLEAMNAAQAVAMPQLADELRQRLQTTTDHLHRALDSRREALHAAAKKEGIRSRRFGEYDRVGPFEIRYAGPKARISLGSEIAAEISEVDGGRLFREITELHQRMEGEPFDREEFFKLLRRAYEMAKLHFEPREGWVPIRNLYALTVMVRNLKKRDFIAHPDSKHFQSYSSAQFVFDLARFGERGWEIGRERLRTQTPAMNTVMQGQTMTLPSLESVESSVETLAVLRIEKAGSD